jgi:uncharacterized membrane protein
VRREAMTRAAIVSLVVAALALAAAATPVQAQATVKVPFNFESGGKKFPSGTYTVAKTGETQITFQQVSTKKETVVPITQKLAPAETSPAGPRLVFDEVGNFEPSYTEYFTVYVLAEVWLSGQEGYLIHTTKGAHKTRTIPAEPAK